MKRNILYSVIGLSLILGISYLYWKPKPLMQLKARTAALLSPRHLPALKHGLKLKSGSYAQLPGWNSADLKQSLRAFQISCHTLLRHDPEHAVGSRYIPLKAKDWYPVCHAATDVDATSDEAIRLFFQTWFMPVEFQQGKPVHGLFTGYYLPALEGSLTKSAEYSVPIYTVPPNLLTANVADFSTDLPRKRIVGHVVEKKMIPFYTRAQIDNGAIAKTTPVIAWVKSPLDRLVLETEGSGIIELKEGGRVAVGYAADNGAKYRAIASILIQNGVMTADEASTSHIRTYFQQHPTQLKSIINQNKSFVFFRELAKNAVVGSQGVPLTPGYTLAVDRKWIPMGIPLWLSTNIHNPKTKAQQPFNRLMVAQDTGGSIRGMVRGDIYWGAGQEATAIATKIRSSGHYWLLLPRIKTLAKNG